MWTEDIHVIIKMNETDQKLENHIQLKIMLTLCSPESVECTPGQAEKYTNSGAKLKLTSSCCRTDE